MSCSRLDIGRDWVLSIDEFEDVSVFCAKFDNCKGCSILSFNLCIDDRDVFDISRYVHDVSE